MFPASVSSNANATPPTLAPRSSGDMLRAPSSPDVNSKRTDAKSRTSHACDRCRLMRTKCSGDYVCERCIRDKAICIYGDRKRERNKKVLRESEQRIAKLEAQSNAFLEALRAVAASQSLDLRESAAVAAVISRYEQGVETSSPTSSKSCNDGARRSPVATILSRTQSGETHASASVGSPAHQDILTHVVDYGKGTGAAGYIGKVSEVAWVERAHRYLINSGNDSSIWLDEISQSHSTAQFLYFMDEEDLLGIDEDLVDPLQLPLPGAASILCEAYFHSVRGAFEFTNRENFLLQMSEVARHLPRLSWEQRKWLASANIMWSIASKWLARANFDTDRAGVENHLLYYARARALGLDHRVICDHPNLDGIQALGLLSLYVFLNGSITRAWALIGMAVRHATGLGLHLKTTDPILSHRQCTERARTWYSIYSLELTMSEILGRLPSIATSDSTVSIDLLSTEPKRSISVVPMNLGKQTFRPSFPRDKGEVAQAGDETQMPGQSSKNGEDGESSLQLSFRVRLCQISHEIIAKIYSPTQPQSWSSVQQLIAERQVELDQWREGLPDDLKLQGSNILDSNLRGKVGLALYCHSTTMILYRPCLCNISIPNESAGSRDFNLTGAWRCVQAATMLVDTLPANPSAQEVAGLLPWWNLLHYLCQAIAVFILELSQGSRSFTTKQLTPFIRKAMSYLWCLTAESLSAYRAWRMFRQMLVVLTSRYGELDVADIPLDAAAPIGWTDRDEASMRQTLRPLVETGLPRYIPRRGQAADSTGN